MASIQKRGDNFQLRVKDKLLQKPFFFTFSTYAEADNYGNQLEKLLEAGVVPQVLLVPPTDSVSPRTLDVIDDYLERAPAVTDSDRELLGPVAKEMVGTRIKDLTYQWVQAYVRRLKVGLPKGSEAPHGAHMSPGSIRKRIGVMGRVVDWHLLDAGGTKAGNPFRMLPVGYSSYSNEDVKLLPAGKSARVDEDRDRRLAPEEEARVRTALNGEKRADRERPLGADEDLTMLFNLILETGLRLMEAYTLRPQQFDFERWVINVEGSKGRWGKIKPRTVPIKPVLRLPLMRWCKARKVRLFKFWDGTTEGKRRTSNKLSVRFKNLFEYAQVDDFSEHDLRHEATCRWILLRNASGNWMFSETEICRIMGWRDPKMMLRYASLRGQDLSNRFE